MKPKRNKAQGNQSMQGWITKMMSDKAIVEKWPDPVDRSNKLVEAWGNLGKSAKLEKLKAKMDEQSRHKK